MITLHEVTKIYKTPAGNFPVLAHLNLRIHAGELVAVVGKSGSGKSTLLNLIAGIDRPSSGSVEVNGTTLKDLNETALALWRGKNLGMVFQLFQLIPTLTASENVMLAMDFVRSVPAAEQKIRALNLLRQVGMEHHAQKLPSALSGGEQQRVAIARALANDPPVILADEPTGNLDTQAARDILSIFASLAAKGRTVVIVTHDPDIAAAAHRTVELLDGKVVADLLEPTR